MDALSTDITVEEVIAAYHSCRKQKRSALSAVEFESNFVENIMSIYRRVRDMTWKPDGHMCFVVMNPKPREVWASQFADRVVHHIVYNRLRPRFEPQWIATSFACIEGRGTGGATAWAKKAAEKVTHGWSRLAFILQVDVRSFFPSIRRSRLHGLLSERVSEPWVQHLVDEVINVDVCENAHFPGNPHLLNLIPGHKTLWNAPPGLGLPIGNLTSQFGANVYLDAMDQEIIRSSIVSHYGRYVDDIVIMDTDINCLRYAYRVIVNQLGSIGLSLHPQKTRFAPVSDGFDFCGKFIKPRRVYVRRRTAKSASKAIHELNSNPHKGETVTSYLALARDCNSYRLRQSWSVKAKRLGVNCNPDLTKARAVQ